jgi:hypothetical protein
VANPIGITRRTIIISVWGLILLAAVSTVYVKRDLVLAVLWHQLTPPPPADKPFDACQIAGGCDKCIASCILPDCRIPVGMSFPTDPAQAQSSTPSGTLGFCCPTGSTGHFDPALGKVRCTPQK